MNSIRGKAEIATRYRIHRWREKRTGERATSQTAAFEHNGWVVECLLEQTRAGASSEAREAARSAQAEFEGLHCAYRVRRTVLLR